MPHLGHDLHDLLRESYPYPYPYPYPYTLPLTLGMICMIFSGISVR